VILPDTSAWVEYLRATGSPTHRRLHTLIANEAELGITDVVVMELLAGASTDERVAKLRRLINRFEFLPVEGLADFEAAAEIYRRCRRGGEAVRKLNDCLIAAVALRVGVPVLHRDQDYEVIARYVPLRIDR